LVEMPGVEPGSRDEVEAPLQSYFFLGFRRRA